MMQCFWFADKRTIVGGTKCGVAAVMLCTLSTLAAANDLHLADAVQLALAQSPDVLVQRAQVDLLRGQESQARGQFDWIATANLNDTRTITPLTNSAVALLSDTNLYQDRQTTTGYQAGLNRQLENGMTIGTTVGAVGTETVASGASQLQQNLVTLNVSLTIPLLKGRDTDSVTAAEQAAKLNVLASQYSLRDQVAQTVYNTLVAYWKYRTLLELEKAAQSNEEHSSNLLASVQKLVDASEKPPADLVLIKADRADKIVARQTATLDRIEAKNALGRVLGIDAAAIAQLPEPADALPDTGPIPYFSAAKIAELGAAAQRQRADLKALSLQLEATQHLLHAASDALKPQLDLQAGLGYAKASEGGTHYGFITEPGRLQSGPSVYAQFIYQFPLQNNVAKGVVTERSANLTQLAIKQRDLSIGIASDVDSAAQALMNSAERLRVAKEGLEFYELALKQEIVKQRNGISTLIDVITVEDRRVTALTNYLQLQLAYADAVANLRLATGTLLPPLALGDDEPDKFSIDIAALSGLGPLSQQAFHPN